MTTLRVGLIGYGMIGKVHAYCYATMPFFAPGLDVAGKIVAVATSREETARAAQRTLNCQVATTDFRAITENPEIDVVHICTPNDQHLPALLSAIGANKHIYCEKPVVCNQSEAEQVRAALEEVDANGQRRYRGISQMAFHLRGFTAIQRAKELVEEGRLGQILQYRLGYYHSSMTSPSAPYRWKHSATGGSILDLASHLLDLIDYLLGLPAEVVAHANTMTLTRPQKPLQSGEALADVARVPVVSEDAITILTRGLLDSARMIPQTQTSRNAYYEYDGNLTVANGSAHAGHMPLAVADASSRAAVSGVIEGTKLCHGAEDELLLELNGTRGSLRFSLMSPHYLEFFDATRPAGVYGGESGWTRIPCGARYPAPQSDFPSPKSTTGWLRAHAASLATFYRSISQGRALGPDLWQGLRVQDALSAIAESARTRERVEVKAR
ncbi:MAG: Gfo/Idh/MocA family oxidoreductase [Planctomycetia bacterium]|nr:Gfo/Idh/MocA family oxidoreductase [Planctomycetia bacterium]